MKPRLPLLLLLGGVITGVFSGNGKEFVPASVDQSFAFHGICIFLGSALLSTGLFLSLRGLFSSSAFRRWFIWRCLFNFVLIVQSLGFYFSGYVEAAHNLETIQSLNRETEALPRLIDAIGIAQSNEKKVMIAKAVYHLYGVKLAYSTQGGQIIYYQPSQQEESDHRASEKEYAENMEAIGLWRDKVQTALNYLPGFFDLSRYFFRHLFYLLALGGIQKVHSKPQLPVLTLD